MKILLAVDHSDASAAAARLVAGQFCAEEAEVCVFHAVVWPQVLSRGFAFARGNGYGAQLRGRMRDARERAAALVGSLAAILRDRGFRTTTAIAEGGLLPAILGRAADWNADLIVLGTHHRSKLDRALFGSLSGDVARQAACSVEIVRPRRS